MWNYFEEGLRWAILVILVLVFVRVLIYLFQGKNKLIALVGVLILGGVIGYTFFTDDGSVRLNITLQGHPLNAYDLKNEMVLLKKENDLSASYYEPSKLLLSMIGERTYHKCKYYGPIRITVPVENI